MWPAMLRSELRTVETVRPATLVAGELCVPGDKSIAHRALMLSSIADGESTVRGLPDGDDVRATMACLRAVGVRIAPVPMPSQPSQKGGQGRGFTVTPPIGAGPGRGFSTPHGTLDCVNSGTTMRLLLGLLAGSRIAAMLDGDASLRRRPMARVIEPLRAMGARVQSSDGYAPLSLVGTRLQGRYHALPVASAQVKSAILLAGLSASGPTTVVESFRTRDHTERLLRIMGADLRASGMAVELRPSHRPLAPLQLTVPGDFSSAAFWMAAAAMRPDWSITIRGVGLNPSRIAFAHLLEAMGAEIQMDVSAETGEPLGSLRVVGQSLRAVHLGPREAAEAIDEIPALLVVATQATGDTVVEGAGELRLKETDRIAAMVSGLRRMGATIDERRDGLTVHGPTTLQGAAVESQGDHRMAMALAIAGLVAAGETTIGDADCVAVSYPEFFQHLQAVTDAR